jgi:hypothetical protein
MAWMAAWAEHAMEARTQESSRAVVIVEMRFVEPEASNRVGLAAVCMGKSFTLDASAPIRGNLENWDEFVSRL